MYTKFNDNNIYYNIYGSGSTVILFLHGWGCSGNVFDPIIKQLESNYTCIVVDFNGHGKSVETSRPFTVVDFADVIYSLIVSLKLSNINIVAHSFGARIAIWLASHHNDLFNRIIITGGAGIVEKNKAKKNLKTYLYKLKKSFFNFIAKISIFKNFALNMQEKLIQKYGSEDYKKLSPLMRKTFVSIVNTDLTQFLSKITSPTLLVWGDKDTETPLSYAKIMNENIPDSAIIIFDGLGHFAFLEDYYRFTKILEKFFEV